jgi:hypothetical protein
MVSLKNGRNGFRNELYEKCLNRKKYTIDEILKQRYAAANATFQTLIRNEMDSLKLQRKLIQLAPKCITKS